jgi:CRISPR-associated protein Cas1
MRLLTSLYITDHRARISARHGSLLVVNGDGSRSRVPLEALEAVVLVGHAQMTSEAIAACATRHVRVASLQGNGKVRYVLGGGLSGNVHLRLAQYRAAQEPERCLGIARWIVAGKLQNARRMLRRWTWDALPRQRRQLEQLDASIAGLLSRLPRVGDGDTVRGFEGEGSRLYFEGLREHLLAAGCQLVFEARNRRPPRDPVNATLSFVYGLLLTEITGAAEAVGLDPQVGYLHGLRPGRPSLALDLMEEFRPAYADRFVVSLLTRKVLGAEDFFITTGGACYLAESGRRKVIESYEVYKTEEVAHALLGRDVARGALPTIQAILMARHLRGDLPAYPPFITAA